MLVIALAMMLSVTTTEGTTVVDGYVCRTKTQTTVSCGDKCVCPKPAVKVKVKKVVVQPPAPPVVEVKSKCCGEGIQQKQEEKQEQHQSVNVYVQNPVAPAPAPRLFWSETSDPYPWIGLGVRGAGGAAFCTPTGIGLLGLRLNLLPVHLGLDVYTQFYYGTGVQLLVYPIQTRSVMWHINGGLIGFNQRPFVTPDLPRQVDLTLGTGLEFRVLPFLWVTADIQARMANPIAIAALNRDFGQVLGQSLLQTPGMLGVMLRTW